MSITITSKSGNYTVEILEHLATLKKYNTGWAEELNIVKWNDGDTVYDIRSWSPNHQSMSKGVTLNYDEAVELVDALSADIYNRDDKLVAPSATTEKD